MRIAFHVLRQPPASVPPRPRLPKSQGVWACTAPASRLAVQSVASVQLKKRRGPKARLVLSMDLSSWRCWWFLNLFLSDACLDAGCEA